MTDREWDTPVIKLVKNRVSWKVPGARVSAREFNEAVTVAVPPDASTPLAGETSIHGCDFRTAQLKAFDPPLDKVYVTEETSNGVVVVLVATKAPPGETNSESGTTYDSTTPDVVELEGELAW